jgi:sodium transport system ATP-binding protein
MIEVLDLHKRFGDVVAVNGLSFRADDGRITALLGPNGSGKTTTMRSLCGLVRPDRGRVLVDHVRVDERPRAARARVGLLPDARGLYQRLTARENVRYYGELHGGSGPDLERRLDELVERLGMRDIADRRVAGFSHGERVKVALARALVHDPPNVVLDEPTVGLDVMSTRAVRRLVRELRAAGRCVLLSSHVMQEVAALCDHIVVMSAGRLVAAGSPEALRERTGLASLEEAFVSLTLGDRYRDDEGGGAA